MIINGISYFEQSDLVYSGVPWVLKYNWVLSTDGSKTCNSRISKDIHRLQLGVL